MSIGLRQSYYMIRIIIVILNVKLCLGLQWARNPTETQASNAWDKGGLCQPAGAPTHMWVLWTCGTSSNANKLWTYIL